MFQGRERNGPTSKDDTKCGFWPQVLCVWPEILSEGPDEVAWCGSAENEYVLPVAADFLCTVHGFVEELFDTSSQGVERFSRDLEVVLCGFTRSRWLPFHYATIGDCLG